MTDRQQYIRDYVRNRYQTDPEFREKAKAATRKYMAKPENKARIREYQRAYKSRPDVRLKAKLRQCGFSEDQIARELEQLARAAE